ncbi:MAG: STAS-like domain-containing protein [Nitrospirales bacterium]|nr:STAS-like domain-containing protein [Nitrospirales bacterium]
METISIVNIVGDKCTGYAEGRKIFDILNGLLLQGLTIVVDMDGISFSSSSFYNAAFGELIIKYDLAFLKDKLHFKNFSAKDRFLFSRSISLAKKVKEEVA